ncbi:hypothetical protein SAMN05216360_12448 [Methylobacterium phyllostachyos]|uniref:Uncharacterized protein n=1 Tax=Methylobacterium phyllostachyos TaxID=582672 RepID=A0A1H0K1T9_9HYPH|nr:hypothetical protein [Methylobacterium phyllostachyos]SDO49712.1 hypothetical protein SAMN05216360_12448 [Methylobacterium phyllostachyos]
MSQFFDIVRDGAACMVEPAWMRTRQVLASATADRSVEARWTACALDWRAGNR